MHEKGCEKEGRPGRRLRVLRVWTETKGGKEPGEGPLLCLIAGEKVSRP